MEGLPRIENCPFLKPSKINVELAKTIGPVLTRRDNRLSRKQVQLAACLSGVAELLSVFIAANEEADKKYVSTLGAVSRLLLDSFHEETAIRQALVRQELNETASEALRKTQAGEWLFGTDVLEKIKAYKALDKSTDELKNYKRSAKPASSVPKNAQLPPRFRSAFCSMGGGGSTPRPAKRNRPSFPNRPTGPKQGPSGGSSGRHWKRSPPPPQKSGGKTYGRR